MRSIDVVGTQTQAGRQFLDPTSTIGQGRFPRIPRKAVPSPAPHRTAATTTIRVGLAGRGRYVLSDHIGRPPGSFDEFNRRDNGIFFRHDTTFGTNGRSTGLVGFQLVRSAVGAAGCGGSSGGR